MAGGQIDNGTFQTGSTGWTLGTGLSAVSNYGYDDSYSLKYSGTTGANYAINNTVANVAPGQSITAKCMIQQGAGGVGQEGGQVLIIWYNAALAEISRSAGNLVVDGSGGEWLASSVTASAPAGALTAKLAIGMFRNSGSFDCWADQASWDYVSAKEVVLLYPLDGETYENGAPVPFRVSITGPGPTPVSVKYTATDTTTLFPTVVGTVTADPWAMNYSTLPPGTYSVVAEVTFNDASVITTAANVITVGTPPPPTTREFKASNAYTYLIGENFSSLASAIPPTAVIKGVELVLDYNLQALIRSKDIGLPDVTDARYQAAFEMVPTGTFSMALLSKSGVDYTTTGSVITATEDVTQSDFTLVEDGTSEGKRWTTLSGSDQTVTLGGEDELFGSTFIPSNEFVAQSIGIRWFPNLAPKPAYADSGDAVFRVRIDKMRLRVYFDAGSVEYYFASPDKTKVIKGRLAAYCIDDGNFANGDASGDLQLTPDLTVMAGSQTYIGADWTIHSQYPPIDANEIGNVAPRATLDPLGMTYNGLPGYNAVMTNRSRYVIISANFYGDESLDSMYGAHGLPRAFAYNGDFFYKICTQPDPVKDSPRHVANHQSHLALGFAQGRVDISVAGQPYNFDGTLGASSWAVGDAVVGLLPLSGAILGVFGSKSITGISGTTVDNFATQTLSPNIGAIEYTTTDMGFPVYANAYGVYTLSQVQQYGDYMGTPLSQPVSPWLRPRLLRKNTSDKEVVVAWPVRSKNQYRLAFSDGFVMSMTLNNGQQAAPTFSFQKYFWTAPGSDPIISANLLDYPYMVPAALSSQLDDSGEERIHIAPTYKEQEYYMPPEPVLPMIYPVPVFEGEGD